MFYQSIHSGTTEYFCKETGENFNYPLHLHNSFEFITISSGEMEVTVEQNKYVIKKGECVLIFPNQVHSLSSTDCKHNLYIFSPDLIHTYYSITTNKIPENNRFKIDDGTLKLLLKLHNDSSLFEKKGVLYLICQAFHQNAEYKNALNNNPNLIQQIFEFIKNNYTSDCSLKKLSVELGYNYDFLSRYFRKTTGISFNNYVNQYKIERSCYLLRTSSLSILECAAESGYSCLRSFNRNFLLYMKVSPQEYRKQSKNL